MKRKWYEKSPELLDTIRTLLAEKYPTLHLYIEGGIVVIRGSFSVKHEGNVLDRYQIEIILPNDYPDSIPIVFEVGGRIPHDPDRHVFKQNGAACLFIPEDRWQAWPKGSSFKDFLEVPVRNFFLSQIHYLRTGKWPEGWEPRSHDVDGIFEAYKELLGIEDEKVILRYIWVLSHNTIKGHWLCPCGSGSVIRNCHIEQVREMQTKISSSLVKRRFKTYSGLDDLARSTFYSSPIGERGKRKMTT